MSWYFQNLNSVARRDDFPKIIIKQTRELPVRGPALQTAAGRRQHETLSGLVHEMLGLQKRVALAKTDHHKIALRRQIEALDKQVDAVVYDLFGLSGQEVTIVENSTAPETVASADVPNVVGLADAFAREDEQ